MRESSASVRLNSFTVRCFAVNRTAVAARVPSDGQADRRAAVITFAVAVGIHMVGVFFTGSLTNRAGFCALMLRIVRSDPRTIRIAVVGIVISGRTAAGASLASAVLGVAVFAPRTGRIAMITVIRSAISTGTAGCRSAMLTGRRIAP